MPSASTLTALLVCALAGAASAVDITADRIAARTACQKECLFKDGWDPVCVWNPKFPKPIRNGGIGSFVYPNECTAKCASQYAALHVPELRGLVVRYRAALPDRCFLKVWNLWFAFGDQAMSDPRCRTCPTKQAPKPGFREIPDDQCVLACADRDGWNPVCVEAEGKRIAYGNSCAALCSNKIISPTPLFFLRQSSNACKTLFLMGKTSPACERCPRGTPNPNLLPIDTDRVAARDYCYKYCDSSRGWDPVCVANNNGMSNNQVVPNFCMAECMGQYARTSASKGLTIRYWVTDLPNTCRTQRFNIWQIDATPPTAPANLIGQCTTCFK